MIDKSLDKIAEEDLQLLVENQISEKKNLEYKAELSLNSDKEKIEFLADISSLANTSGGDLYIGIIENREKGTPKEIRGFRLENPDIEILRIESLIRDGIRPRLILVKLRCIKLANENSVILIRIPQSWMSPHRVILKGHDKFYSRNSAGKYQMDVDELRNAFTLADTVSKNIGKFKNERIGNIQLDETPVPFYEPAKTILHIIPLISLSRPIGIDIKSLVCSRNHLNKMHPMGHTSHEERYNIDGYLTYAIGADNNVSSYFQFYRNGIIESAEAHWLKSNKTIQITLLEKGIIDSLSDYLNLLNILRVPTPIFIFLTLIGIKEHKILPPNVILGTWAAVHTIGRDVLQLPELYIEDYPTKVDSVLRPIFNSLWNAGGYPEDPHYTDDGTWVYPKPFIR